VRKLPPPLSAAPSQPAHLLANHSHAPALQFKSHKLAPTCHAGVVRKQPPPFSHVFPGVCSPPQDAHWHTQGCCFQQLLWQWPPRVGYEVKEHINSTRLRAPEQAAAKSTSVCSQDIAQHHYVVGNVGSMPHCGSLAARTAISTAQHNYQHSTAQHSTAQLLAQLLAQHSTAQHKEALKKHTCSPGFRIASTSSSVTAASLA
jgi:hypothetical protein